MIRIAATLLLATSVVAGLSCARDAVFRCETDLQCEESNVRGLCEPEGVCSVPDLGCMSGRRYGDYSGDKSGLCVDDSVATTTATGSGSGGASGEGSTGTPDETSEAGTTADAATDTSGPTTSAGSSTSGGQAGKPYGPCDTDDDCVGQDETCVVGSEVSVCAPPCLGMVPRDCPTPESGTVTPVCIDIGGPSPRCVLQCDNDMACPAEMSCELGMGVGFCGWPSSGTTGN